MEGQTITKHIMAGNIMLSTVTKTTTGSVTTTTVNTILTDHLTGSAVVLDKDNKVIETTDYFPFGQIRLDEKATPVAPTNSTLPFSEQRKYIGQEFDAGTGLNYLNARYYNGVTGRFTSQDPMFWTLPKELLSDPQQLNAYAYARNNPITMSDPSGLMPTAKEAAIMANQIYQNGNEGKNLTGGWKYNSILPNTANAKIGVYSRTQTDNQCVPLEYSLVGRGTTKWIGSDGLNNFAQPFGLSPDMSASLSRTTEFVNNHKSNEVTFVGHSKAGAEAMAGAIKNNKNAIIFNPASLNTLGLNISSYTAQVNEYIVRGEILNSIFGSVSTPFGSHDSVIYLPSQHPLSWGQVFQNGLIQSLWTNSTQNHSMESVVSGLGK
jgi:RHS repeat-associated protein